MGLPRASFFVTHQEKTLCMEKLEMVGLDASFVSQSFHSLSGGQKQRVIIARSLLSSPTVLLFDEPLSGVDFPTKLQIYELLSHINTEYGITIVFVSHEIESVVSECHRILCLNKTLHEGCHPMDFIRGNVFKKPCIFPKKRKSIPIHHHHL